MWVERVGRQSGMRKEARERQKRAERCRREEGQKREEKESGMRDKDERERDD